jgi:hypothetical protein
MCGLTTYASAVGASVVGHSRTAAYAVTLSVFQVFDTFPADVRRMRSKVLAPKAPCTPMTRLVHFEAAFQAVNRNISQAVHRKDFLRVLVAAFVLISLPAFSQVPFFDDFERSDTQDIGNWDVLQNPGMLEALYSPSAAKVGARGARFIDSQSKSGDGPGIGLVKDLPSGVSQSRFIRSWIKLSNLAGSGQVSLLKLNNQSFVSLEMYLSVERRLRFRVWYKDASQAFVFSQTELADVLPLDSWVLVELGAINMGSNQGVAWASVDGKEVLRQTVDWSSLFPANIQLGLNFATYAFTGTVDFDAFAASDTPQPTRLLAVTQSSAPANTCIRVQFELESTYERAAAPAFHPTLQRIELSGDASGVLFEDALCSKPLNAFPLIGTSKTGADVYVRPTSPGILKIQAIDADFLSVPANIIVTLDETDSGIPILDAGTTGSPDAAIVDGGTDTSPRIPDDGAVQQDSGLRGPRQFLVGCGCSLQDSAPFWGLLAVMLCRLRRSSRNVQKTEP